jgi:hypothetical protein
MDWLSGQVMAVSRGPEPDSEGWWQLLVFIVLAVFWAAGGIMKARSAAKAQTQKGKKPQGPGPGARARPSFERLLRAQPEKVRTRPGQTQAAKMARRFERDKAAREQMKEPVTAQTTQYSKEILAEVEKVEHTSEAALVEAPMERATAALAGQGIELGTSEQLRAAILHYEIFGKCVAMREGREQAWMR